MQSVKMAWNSIFASKMRSFLTMLGMIIGVVSLVVLVSLVKGSTSSVTDSISGIGSNLFTVSIRDNKEKPLKLDEVSQFTEEDELKSAAPVTQTSVTAKSGSTSESATVYGTTGAYGEIQGLELQSGRFLKSADVENHSRVAVISSDMAVDIIGRPNAVGQTIKLDGIAYQVIGVLKEDENDSESSSVLEAYIPYTSLIRLSDQISSEITTFVVAAANEESMEEAEVQLTELLMNRFDADEDAFSIRNQSAVLEAMQSVGDTMSLLLGGIAGISLLVGGIGIMNIMMVSVTERTKEIGIRKAIGAWGMNIMQQFLIEALMISLLGCLIGLGLSVVILQIINMTGGTAYNLSVNAAWIATGFSLGIGVIFGMYPASKAAKKNPIEALRYSA